MPSQRVTEHILLRPIMKEILTAMLRGDMRYDDVVTKLVREHFKTENDEEILKRLRECMENY